MSRREPADVPGGGNARPGSHSGVTQLGVPGGGENTHSWRHREIVAAFEPLEVTDAVAQADRFERIALGWADALRAFQHAVGESLAQAWSGSGATAAGAAVDAYIENARDLTVALEQLPGVVRAAADAIVASKHAIGSPVVDETGASARSVSGAVHDTGSASAHGAAAAALESARAAMRHRYVLPFAELVDRIPIPPMPIRAFDSWVESGDRHWPIAAAGQSWGERRARSPVGMDIAAGIGQDGSAAIGKTSPRVEAIRDSESAGHDGHGTGDPPAGSGGVTGGPAESDGGATTRSTDLDSDARAGSTFLNGGDALAAGERGSSTASASAAPGGVMPSASARSGGPGISVPGGVGSLAAPWWNSAAAIDPATASAGRNSLRNPYAGLTGHATATDGSGDRTSGGGPRYQPPGRHDVQRPGVGHSTPGAAGSVIGANPSAGHTSTRSVDRFVHCTGAPVTQSSPGIETVRGLPEYLITQANTEELLGNPLPAVAGGVIGGDDGLLPGEQRSLSTRG